MVTRFVDFPIRLLDTGSSAQSVSDRPNGKVASKSDSGTDTLGGLRPHAVTLQCPPEGAVMALERMRDFTRTLGLKRLRWQIT